MKQHINIEQQEELTKEAINKLASWLDKKGYLRGKARKYSFEGVPFYDIENYPTPLSIGQMIEFLEDCNDYIDISHDYCSDENSSTNGQSYWTVLRGVEDDNVSQSTELCDALWEAVKEVLENES